MKTKRKRRASGFTELERAAEVVYKHAMQQQNEQLYRALLLCAGATQEAVRSARNVLRQGWREVGT